MTKIMNPLALASLTVGMSYKQEAAAEVPAAGGEAPPAAPAVANGKEFTFFFKKEFAKDDKGEKIGEGYKHPDVKAVLPVPTVEEVINGLAQEGKVRDFIMDVVSDAVFQVGRAQINDWRENNDMKEFKPTSFDLSKMTLEAIANMPKGQRGAWAPDEEDHKDFAEDYTAAMVNKVNYDPKKVKVHLDHFKNGFAKIKTNKPVISKLLEFLTLWAANTEQMEDNKATYEWLVNRANKYLKAEEKNLLEAL